jgi:hypothetical protein
VRLEGFDAAPDPEQVIVDAQDLHVVPNLLQCLDDVVLHLPIGLEDVDACRVLGRNEMVVDEREHSESFHRNNRWPPLWR